MEKMIIIQFSFIFKKQLTRNLNDFCSFLSTVEQTADGKKTGFKFFLKNMLAIQFPYMKIVCQTFSS